jgi:hypothetical protein
MQKEKKRKLFIPSNVSSFFVTAAANFPPHHGGGVAFLPQKESIAEAAEER